MRSRAFVVAAALAAGVSMACVRAGQGPDVQAAPPSPEAAPAPAATPPQGVAVIPLALPSGKVLQAEVMVRDEDRQRGLMFRDSLAPDRGMLFVFRELDRHGIWMKNCRFPIDIVWLDEERRVVHVEEAVPPCRQDPCPVYEPMRAAAYVLEINAGQARRDKAVVGARLEFELPR